jgi:hypothetical protein
MADEKQKDFGKRAPLPVVVHKPKASGAKAAAAPLFSGQKRSLAVSLALMGALALGAYEAIDWIDKKLNCEPDPANPEELICKHRNGSSYHRSYSSGWHSSSGSGSSSTHGVSYGGFGHSGGSHSGGG